MKQTYEALHERRFDVLAVSFDNDRAVLERFLESEKVPWQIVCGTTDSTAGLDHVLARKYGVQSLPKSFLIDSEGNIAAIDLHGAELLKLAEQLLGAEDEKKAAR